ncbi:hypothetical protein Ddye_000748 [Dipteronia dyeriana]|uniref:tRNA pseudouridine synthase n=1 Tax=Dipteronia dyeriana TaxID=168575 RepID=A0AAD9XMB0_9ROSI|nr:hypothetical protein Ddye_000748 [Dipteronia dyeriana]
MSENPKHSLDTTHQSHQRPLKIARTEEEQIQESGTVSNPMGPNPRLQRYLVAFEYIGTRFSGSQQQLKCRTAVGVLEEAFRKFIGQPVSIFCSSRTDAGVHALSNVCHVDVERISKRKPGEMLPPHEATVVRRAVNHFLQKEGDIMVTDVRCVPTDFHARYKAQERTYFYRLLCGSESLSIFEKDSAWHVPEELDLHAMQKACEVLIGHHDFSSFRASGCQAKSPIRTIDELHVSEVPSSTYFPCMESNAYSIKSASDLPFSSTSDSDSHRFGLSNGGNNVGFGTRKRHRCYVVKVRARAFLYHQVRLIVGVLKSVGTGDLNVSDGEATSLYILYIYVHGKNSFIFLLSQSDCWHFTF